MYRGQSDIKENVISFPFKVETIARANNRADDPTATSSPARARVYGNKYETWLSIVIRGKKWLGSAEQTRRVRREGSGFKRGNAVAYGETRAADC